MPWPWVATERYGEPVDEDDLAGGRFVPSAVPMELPALTPVPPLPENEKSPLRPVLRVTVRAPPLKLSLSPSVTVGVAALVDADSRCRWGALTLSPFRLVDHRRVGCRRDREAARCVLIAAIGGAVGRR